MIETPKILQTVVQPTAIIHITIPKEQIRNVMEPGLKELLATLGKQGIAPTGPWFTRHLKMMRDTYDFEIGVPVKERVVAAGRVTAGQLPAATVARTILHGSYEGLASAWPKLDAWIVAQGRAPGPALWETYLIDAATNPDPSTWRTELTRPLAK